MERKRKVPLPDGSVVDGTEVGFRSSGEHWNEYLADDGSVIRLKLVVTEIMRLDDTYEPDGTPSYAVKSTTVMATSAPDELRRNP